MHLMYYMNAAGRRVYTLKKEAPNGEITFSAHPGKRAERERGQEKGGLGWREACADSMVPVQAAAKHQAPCVDREEGGGGGNRDCRNVMFYFRRALGLALIPISPHPYTARFSPDDKFSKQRLTLKKRFNLLPTQQGERVL